MLQEGSIDLALETVRQHLQGHPNDTAAHELLIDILNGIGRNQEAVLFYSAATQVPTANADAWYLLGRTLLDPPQAEDAFNRALALEPDHARAWMGLGAVRRVKDQSAEATEAYQRAIALDRTLSEAWLGWIAITIAEGGDALSIARQARAAIPSDPNVRLLIAQLDPSNATIELTDAMRKLPSDPRIPAMLARTLFESKKWDLAEDAYRQALELNPSAADLRVELALVKEIRSGVLRPEDAQSLLEFRGPRDGDPGASIPKLDQIVSNNPNSGWARLIRGNVKNSAGEAKSAEKDLRAALDRMPASPEAQSALGLVMLNKHQAAEATSLLTFASERRPHDVSLAVAAAMARAEAGDLPGAEIALREAQVRFPTSTGPILGLARIRLSHGDPEGAVQILANAFHEQPSREIFLALTAAAIEAGQGEQAAAMLDEMADKTNNETLREAANQLRNVIRKDVGNTPKSNATGVSEE